MSDFKSVAKIEFTSGFKKISCTNCGGLIFDLVHKCLVVTFVNKI